MNPQAVHSHTWIKVGSISGISSIVLFAILVAATLPSYLEVFLVAYFGICFSLCGFGIHHLISLSKQSVLSQIASIFILISGLLFSLMLIIQLTFRGYLNDRYEEAIDDTSVETLNLIVRTIDPIQLSIQICNDFFVASALILFAIAMYRNTHFEKIWSISAMLIGIVLIGVKCYSFPYTPEEAGLPGVLGPIIALWFLLISIKCLISVTKLKKMSG
ncbi:MAG: hypothetical protein AAGC47_15050 [Bacteroidota bacterium]